MKILGLEIRKIEKKDMPQKVKSRSFTLDPDITNKAKDYMLGNLKGGPFSRKKNQSYLHYDGIRIANNRIHWMWKGEVIMSQAIIGPYTGDPLDIYGISGKLKINLT
ncbi:MAG: hypothetical protein ACUZ8I_07320 [Candidatus Scalindua sp.]